MLINNLGNSEDNPCGSSGFCMFRDVKSWAQLLQSRRRRAFQFLGTLPPDPEQWTESARALAQWADSDAVRASATYHDDAINVTVFDYSGAIAKIIPMIHEGDALLLQANAPTNKVPGEYGSSTSPTAQIKSIAAIAVVAWIFSRARG